MSDAPFVIDSERLRLVSASIAHLRADLDGPAALGRALGCAVTPDWPPDLYDRAATEYTLREVEADPANAAWRMYYVVLRDGAGDTVIGLVGYKGPPDADGTVEIGYGITPTHQRRGYASEAAEALTRRAFADPRVRRVIAETLPELEASQRVLLRNGFALVGEGSEPGVIRFARAR